MVVPPWFSPLRIIAPRIGARQQHVFGANAFKAMATLYETTDWT
jgi:hypothetical protein